MEAPKYPIRKIEDGELVGMKTDRLPLSLYGDPPRWKVSAPGTAIGNVSLAALLDEASKLQIQEPRTYKVKVMFRFRPSEVLLLVAPTDEDGLDVHTVKYEGASHAPTIRGLKRLFADNRIKLDPSLWYDLETEVAEDATLGFCVSASWTAARLREKSPADKDVAAEEQ